MSITGKFLKTTFLFVSLACALILTIVYLVKADNTSYGARVLLSQDESPKAVLSGMAADSLDALYAAQLRLRGETKASPVDGMVIIYIPAGEFRMGSNRLEVSSPAHKVYLDAYWIDSIEVSNRMYALCVKAGVCQKPAYFDTPELFLEKALPWGSDYGNLPVVYIRWSNAEQYCRWAGRRLPTEAEWEKAARGVDRRKFPWGSSSPNANLLNFASNIDALTPVGRYPSGASPYGVLNMAGNVREWVADWSDPHYYEEKHYYNPQGPPEGDKRILRGGDFKSTSQMVNPANRFAHNPNSSGYNRGFRCTVSDEGG